MGQRLNYLGKATAAILSGLIAPFVGRDELADAVGYIENAGVPSAVVPNFIGQRLFDTTGSVFYIAYGLSAGNWAVMGNDALSAAELEFLDGVTAGTAAASKAVVLSATKGIDTFRVTDRIFGSQGAPSTATDTATLTEAQCLARLIVATPTAAANYTTPTGAVLDIAVLAAYPAIQADDTFDLTIINIGGTGDDITLVAGATGITIVGEAIIRPVADSATDGATGQGTFRFRRTAADTYIIYRVA